MAPGAAQLRRNQRACTHEVAEAALKKIPLLGAVSQKVGNACVNVLAELPGREPVSQLSRLAQWSRLTARR